jgi:CMP-N-acetylneuraminic acid synthetase
MKITALLPMKGHSERVPNKNMRLFAGNPLYHCIARVLEDSPLISSIVINTDSPVIAKDAEKHFSKVRIVNRPENLQGDMVPMNDIIGYDISVCEEEHFVQTHSTNPLLKRETLEKGIASYFDKLTTYDSVFSVTKLQTRLYWESGEPVNHNPRELLRTQDLPSLFEENSNFFIFSRSSFQAAGQKRIGVNPFMLPMDKLEALDIDEEEDFVLAETLMTLRQSKG